MSRKNPSPLALALLLLTRRQGWEQNEIAAALGVSPGTVSGWIRTGDGLDRARLEQIVVEVLKLDAEEIGRALRYLTEDEPFPPAPGLEELTPQERRIVEEATADLLKVVKYIADQGFCKIVLKDRKRGARAEAEACWKRLLAAAPEERTLLLDGVSAFQTPAFCARICAESRDAASSSASRALKLAKLALYVAQRVPGDVSLRCQAYAWAFIANAVRVSGKLPKADRAFARAHELWAASTKGDPFISEVRFLELEASLRRDQRRIDEALNLLAKAMVLAKPSEKGNILLNKERVQNACGEFHEAIETLHEAESCIDREREPRSWFAVQFNLTSNYCGLGRFEEAEVLFKDVCELGLRLDRDLDLIRLRWLGAQVKAGLGEEEEAVQAFEDLRKEYVGQKNPFDSALVSLDLAELYLRQERWLDVHVLAEEMIQVFRSLGVQREPLAALLLFQEAVRRQRATTEFVRRLARYLNDARRDPSYRFSG
jgi:tetratricopeptide (TPR) repeat protein/transcriptional regulator with XRE-family HTH domain